MNCPPVQFLLSNFSLSTQNWQEGLAVSKDLRVEQSFEDLEAAFEPGGNFRFDAVVVTRK